jgi:arginyl-tRNA synthetase
MMSSRTGNIITYQDLHDQIFKRAEEETIKRHPDWPEEKAKRTARFIALGAMKFEMLKVGSNQVITFDIIKALKFDGFTAAYLQYTVARINSIFKKSKIKSANLKISASSLTEDRESGLIIKLAKYPEVLKRSAQNYDPSEIAKYLFELAQQFNDYYHAVPVLQAETEIRLARLELAGCVRQVIINGLAIMNIDTPDEM